MADDVFAGVGSDKAYVFRRSFADKKWENVAKDNKTSKVHFLKRSGNYFFKVSPEDGITPVRKAGGGGWEMGLWGSVFLMICGMILHVQNVCVKISKQFDICTPHPPNLGTRPSKT